MSESRCCVDCGGPLQKKPGPGRWPNRCGECRLEYDRAKARRRAHLRSPRPAAIGPGQAWALSPSGLSRSDVGRAGGLAAARSLTREELSERGRKGAAARAAKYGYAPRVETATSPCPYCGELMRGVSRKQCGAGDCRLRYNAERSRGFMHERRARIRNNDWERFNPVEVYERDGWVCGLCDEPVDSALRFPDPRSVSLDHITPVSLGGPHTRVNTRCSHLGCNSRRGNRVA